MKGVPSSLTEVEVRSAEDWETSILSHTEHRKIHRPPGYLQKKLLQNMGCQKLKCQNQWREMRIRTLIGIQMMYRTDCAHPALLRVLVKSCWVSPWKTHLLPGEIYALCQNVSLNLGGAAPGKGTQSGGQAQDDPSNEQQPKAMSEGNVVNLFASTEEL